MAAADDEEVERGVAVVEGARVRAWAAQRSAEQAQLDDRLRRARPGARDGQKGIDRLRGEVAQERARLVRWHRVDRVRVDRAEGGVGHGRDGVDQRRRHPAHGRQFRAGGRRV
jgi:hypothetical protein